MSSAAGKCCIRETKSPDARDDLLNLQLREMRLPSDETWVRIENQCYSEMVWRAGAVRQFRLLYFTLRAAKMSLIGAIRVAFFAGVLVAYISITTSLVLERFKDSRAKARVAVVSGMIVGLTVIAVIVWAVTWIPLEVFDTVLGSRYKMPLRTPTELEATLGENGLNYSAGIVYALELMFCALVAYRLIRKLVPPPSPDNPDHRVDPTPFATLFSYGFMATLWTVCSFVAVINFGSFVLTSWTTTREKILVALPLTAVTIAWLLVVLVGSHHRK